MLKNIIVTILILCFMSPAFAIKPWVDTWNKVGYHTTNTEKNNFNALIGRSELRVGVDLSSELEDVPSFSPYVASILVASQDPNYWVNNWATGYGVRIMPFENYESEFWSDQWIKNVKVYAEVLQLTFLRDESTATTNNVLTTDKRVGFDVYHEWNQEKPDKKRFWSEMWSNLSYRSTNFYQGGFRNLIWAHEQKTGIYLEDDKIKPYLRTDSTISGRAEPWWNVALVGPGIQFEPFKQNEEIYGKLNLFVELLAVIWYKDSGSRPNSDIRLGTEYRLYLK